MSWLTAVLQILILTRFQKVAFQFEKFRCFDLSKIFPCSPYCCRQLKVAIVLEGKSLQLAADYLPTYFYSIMLKQQNSFQLFVIVDVTLGWRTRENLKESHPRLALWLRVPFSFFPNPFVQSMKTKSNRPALFKMLQSLDQHFFLLWKMLPRTG